MTISFDHLVIWFSNAVNNFVYKRKTKISDHVSSLCLKVQTCFPSVALFYWILLNFFKHWIENIFNAVDIDCYQLLSLCSVFVLALICKWLILVMRPLFLQKEWKAKTRSSYSKVHSLSINYGINDRRGIYYETDVLLIGFALKVLLVWVPSSNLVIMFFTILVYKRPVYRLHVRTAFP